MPQCEVMLSINFCGDISLCTEKTRPLHRLYWWSVIHMGEHLKFLLVCRDVLMFPLAVHRFKFGFDLCSTALVSFLYPVFAAAAVFPVGLEVLAIWYCGSLPKLNIFELSNFKYICFWKHRIWTYLHFLLIESEVLRQVCSSSIDIVFDDMWIVIGTWGVV